MNFFSRIELDPRHPGAREALLTGAGSIAYDDHQSLWRFFPAEDGAAREFLFRRIEPQGSRQRPGFYVVSARPPLVPHPAWHVQTRPYDPRLSTGDRLVFELRVNPVQTHVRDGRSKRDDVVMHAKKQMTAQHGVTRWSAIPEDVRPPLYTLVHQAVMAWFGGEQDRPGLAARYGFRLVAETLQVDAYRQHRLHRRGGKPIQISTVDLSGVLEVGEPGLSRDALLKGMGHGKAFGCGLLLVRRT